MQTFKARIDIWQSTLHILADKVRGKLRDVKILCRGFSWMVHRDICTTKSAQFYTEIVHAKEKNLYVINLDRYHPVTVFHLVIFLYTGHYDLCAVRMPKALRDLDIFDLELDVKVPGVNDNCTFARPLPAEEPLTHLNMYIAARTHKIPDLRRHSIFALHNMLHNTPVRSYANEPSFSKFFDELYNRTKIEWDQELRHMMADYIFCYKEELMQLGDFKALWKYDKSVRDEVEEKTKNPMPYRKTFQDLGYRREVWGEAYENPDYALALDMMEIRDVNMPSGVPLLGLSLDELMRPQVDPKSADPKSD